MTGYAAHQIVARRDAIVAELERELAHRERIYPDWIAKCRMSEQEAGYQLGVWREILDNVRECLAGASCNVTAIAVAWREKVKALERELDYRTRLYPEWIDKGRLDQADADRQLELVAMVRDLYWRHLFAWLPPAGPARTFVDALRSGTRLEDPAAREAYELAVADHLHAVDGDGANQAELLL